MASDRNGRAGNATCIQKHSSNLIPAFRLLWTIFLRNKCPRRLIRTHIESCFVKCPAYLSEKLLRWRRLRDIPPITCKHRCENWQTSLVRSGAQPHPSSSRVILTQLAADLRLYAVGAGYSSGNIPVYFSRVSRSRQRGYLCSKYDLSYLGIIYARCADTGETCAYVRIGMSAPRVRVEDG